MTDLDQRMRRVRIALLLFGIPFVLALTALAFQPELMARFSALTTDMFTLAASVTGALVLLVIIIGWFGDRQALRRQDRQLLERGNELALYEQKLEARDKQHLLELSLKDKQIEKEIAIREERSKFYSAEPQSAVRAPEPDSSSSDDTSTTPSARRGPPASLSRPRRTLMDADVSASSGE